MARYVGTILTSRPGEEVFDYMADFTSVAEWDGTVTRADRVGSKPPGLGAHFEVVVRMLGRENELCYETIEYERPHRFVLKADAGALTSVDEVRVRETAEGTELVYDAKLEPNGLMKLADPVLGLLFKRLGNQAADGLARELSGQVVRR